MALPILGAGAVGYFIYQSFMQTPGIGLTDVNQTQGSAPQNPVTDIPEVFKTAEGVANGWNGTEKYGICSQPPHPNNVKKSASTARDVPNGQLIRDEATNLSAYDQIRASSADYLSRNSTPIPFMRKGLEHKHMPYHYRARAHQILASARPTNLVPIPMGGPHRGMPQEKAALALSTAITSYHTGSLDSFTVKPYGVDPSSPHLSDSGVFTGINHGKFIKYTY